MQACHEYSLMHSQISSILPRLKARSSASLASYIDLWLHFVYLMESIFSVRSPKHRRTILPERGSQVDLALLSSSSLSHGNNVEP